ncbi:hypothetical protein [uncultured Brachyspira sp.]|uniref:hypothetical protein n=1 Tax=uncultured Brachyspira sp. TaxID=221953 RepID=UPI00262C376A|nr:hypothetical protein [uncultured Brachyspira sp.]
MKNFIKEKMKKYRDSILIKEDMLLSVKSDIERSIDYFSEHTEGNKMAANSKELVIYKIAALTEELALVEQEINKLNKKTNSLFYRLINRMCGDTLQEYDNEEYYIKLKEEIIK